MENFTPHFDLLQRNALRCAAVLVGIALVTCAGCGGGGNGANDTFTNTTITVMDGLIYNALVCVDSNSNGTCDSGEIQGRTDVNGNVTLAIPDAKLASAKLVAMVGTDAVDADTGSVKTAYTMTAPPGKLAVVSPLTTLVAFKVNSDGISVAEAESQVQTQYSLIVSPLANFIAGKSSSANSTDYDLALQLARKLVSDAQNGNNGVIKPLPLTCKPWWLPESNAPAKAAAASSLNTVGVGCVIPEVRVDVSGVIEQYTSLADVVVNGQHCDLSNIYTPPGGTPPLAGLGVGDYVSLDCHIHNGVLWCIPYPTPNDK